LVLSTSTTGDSDAIFYLPIEISSPLVFVQTIASLEHKIIFTLLHF